VAQRSLVVITTPTPQPRYIPKRRRYIPDRPANGYHVQPADEITTDLAGLDHIAEIATALQRLTEADELMDRLERRADRLYARLADATLARQYGPEHPLRIEAEDRLTAIDRQWNAALINATQWASLVHAHGGYLLRDGQGEALDLIGRDLVHGWGALGRVQRSIDGLMTGSTWQRLAAAACPF
jgi:hypothetical protein